MKVANLYEISNKSKYLSKYFNIFQQRVIFCYSFIYKIYFYTSFYINSKYKNYVIALDKSASIKRRRGTRQFLLGGTWRKKTL